MELRLNRKRIFFCLCLVACFIMGFFSKGAFQTYFGVNLVTFIKSPLAYWKPPLAYWRVQQRGWNSFNTLQYTQEHGDLHFHRNVETALLPLSVDGTRLSDAYPVPKGAGAITVVGTTVIILDRLGGLYRYDMTIGSFGMLSGIPQLPNNLAAYLVQRPGPPVNLADAPNGGEFRARDIIFLSDRNELVVAFDKFDETFGKTRIVVSIIPFDPMTLTAKGSWQQIFASDGIGFGVGAGLCGAGRLAYRGDGKLYLTVGDYCILDQKVADDPDTTLGKIIEVDLTTNKWRQFTKGHRNPEGLTFLKSGQLLSTEHGPNGGDELNVITEGSDYGMPNVSLGTKYNSYDWIAGTSLVGSHKGYKAPLFAWLPSIAPTQLIEINNFSSRWDGDLLIGSLKASSLYRLRLEDGRVMYSERIWVGERIRDLAQTSNGTIVLWTDDTKLLFVTVDQDQLAVRRRTPNIIGSGIVDEECMGCHHFGSTNPTDLAPSLSNLLNRPIASDTFSYSPALHAKQNLGHWTPALLSEFLSDPFKFASGTNMVPLKLGPEQIKDIVDALVRASGGVEHSPVGH